MVVPSASHELVKGEHIAKKRKKKKAWNMKNHNYDFKPIEFFPHGNYQVGL